MADLLPQLCQLFALDPGLALHVQLSVTLSLVNLLPHSLQFQLQCRLLDFPVTSRLFQLH